MTILYPVFHKLDYALFNCACKQRSGVRNTQENRFLLTAHLVLDGPVRGTL